MRNVIGLREGVATLAVMQMLMLPEHQLFICDTHVNRDPSAEQVAEIALLAAEEVRRFGVTPRVALLSHSSFGSSDAPSARKMREARELVARARRSWRWRARCAAMRRCRRRSCDTSSRTPASAAGQRAGDAQHRRREHLLQPAAAWPPASGITVGGILLGAARPAHVLTPSATVRRIVNMTALAVVDAALASAPAEPVRLPAPAHSKQSATLQRSVASVLQETQMDTDPSPKPFYRSLYFQVITAIVIGILLGHFYPETGAAMKPLGDGFIKLIKMIIAPIIFCTVVVGIAGMEDMKKRRQDRRAGAALLRDREHDRADRRPGDRQPRAARRRHERRPGDARHQEHRGLHGARARCRARWTSC